MGVLSRWRARRLSKRTKQLGTIYVKPSEAEAGKTLAEKTGTSSTVMISPSGGSAGGIVRSGSVLEPAPTSTTLITTTTPEAKPSAIDVPTTSDTSRLGFGEATRRTGSEVWDWIKSDKGVALGYAKEKTDTPFDPYKQVGEIRKEGDIAFYDPQFGTTTDRGGGSIGVTYGDVKGRIEDIYGLGFNDLPPSPEAGYQGISTRISGDISTEYQSKIDTGELTLEQAQPLAEAEYTKRYSGEAEQLSGYYKDIGGLGIGKRPTGEALAKWTPIALETGALVGASLTGGVGLGLASTYIVGAGTKEFQEGIYDTSLTGGQRAGKIGLGVGTIALGFTGIGSGYRAVERGVISGEIGEAISGLSKQELKAVSFELRGDKLSEFKLIGGRELGGIRQQVFLEGDILKTGKQTFLIPKGRGKSVVEGFVPDYTLYPGKKTKFLSGQMFEYRGKGISFGKDELSFGISRGGLTPISEGGIIYKEGLSMQKILGKFDKSIISSVPQKEFSYGIGVSVKDPFMVRPKVYYTKGFSPEQIIITTKGRPTVALFGQKTGVTSYVLPKPSDMGAKILGGVGGRTRTPFSTTFGTQELQAISTSALTQVSKPSIKLATVSKQKITADLRSAFTTQRGGQVTSQIVKPDFQLDVKQKVSLGTPIVSLRDIQKPISTIGQRERIISAFKTSLAQQMRVGQREKLKLMPRQKMTLDTRQFYQRDPLSSYKFSWKGFIAPPFFILPKGGAMDFKQEVIGLRSYKKTPSLYDVTRFKMGFKVPKQPRGIARTGFVGYGVGLKLPKIELGPLIGKTKRKNKK